MSYEHDYGTPYVHINRAEVWEMTREKKLILVTRPSFVGEVGDKTRWAERARARKEHATKIEKGKKTAERLGGDEEGPEEKKK